MEPGQVLTAVGPAAALTLLILLATHEPWRAAPRATPRWRAAGGAVAVAGAFVLAAVCLGYWRGVWPGGAHERLPLAAAIIGLAGTASALSKGALVRLATRAAASAVVVWMLAWPLLGGAPVAARTLIWLPGLAGAVLA